MVTSSKRTQLCVKVLVFAAFLSLLYIFTSLSRASPALPFLKPHDGVPQASLLLASDLMNRTLPGSRPQISKLLHQSWSSSVLPGKFAEWSRTCREMHPEWEWVLWTDDDNREVVRRFMPELLPTFEKLEGPIFRADLVRNVYMMIFGGVYMDLDVECLRPSEELFEKHNVSAVSPWGAFPVAKAAEANMTWDVNTAREEDNSKNIVERGTLKAFVGSMGDNASFEHSIPNAWIASAPGHPLFHFMLHRTKKAVMSGKKLDSRPEAVTGPIALRLGIWEFNSTRDLANEMLPDDQKYDADVVVLPSSLLYPYSWWKEGDAVRDLCSAVKNRFNATLCKEKLEVEKLGSWAITYWSHSWTNGGHDKGNLKKISG